MLSQHEHDAPRVVVAICTYNERDNIVAMLDRIAGAMPSADILVVDDDSPDGTAQTARAHAATMPIRVVVEVRQNKRGLGGAILAAMRYAVDHQYAWLINLDADLSHDPDDVPRLFEASSTHQGADVIVGSRYVAGGQIEGWPWHRKWMSRTLNGFTRLLLNLPVRDASGSFRCYRVATLQRVMNRWEQRHHQPSNGYSFLQEVMLSLQDAGASFVEVPITFTDRVAGTSKLDFREAMRSAATIARLKTR
ncbi:MAG: polyprenol monophosphomannose synthase [Planctomycetota bacterium]